MSADLLAEFDSFYQAPNVAQSQSQLDRPQRRSKSPVTDNAGQFAPSSKNQTDLWNFGNFGTSALTKSEQRSDQLQTITGSAALSSGKQGVDDGWGDFESGENESQTGVQVVNQESRYGATDPIKSSQVALAHPESIQKSGKRDVHKPPTANVRSSPMPAFTPHLQSNHSTNKQATMRPPRDENVLFDAEEDVDDEFGDFESAQEKEPPPLPSKILPKLSNEHPKSFLLDFEASIGNSHFAPMLPTPTTLPDFRTSIESQSETMDPRNGRELSPANSGDLTTIQPPTFIPTKEEHDAWEDLTGSLPVTKPFNLKPEGQKREVPRKNQMPSNHADVDDGAWDDFEESVPGPRTPDDRSQNLIGSSSLSRPIAPVVNYPGTAANSESTSYALTFDTILPQTDSGTASPPPSNIPPPALILTLFRPIIDLAHTQLLEPLASQSNSPATKDAILANPETRTFLASYLAVGNVLARIIAGRKLRWKRDNLLAQSMRIGPASTSGKSGGMKLAGIDRGENAKEEREVADVLRSWRGQLGRLRSAVSGAGPIGTVPEIMEASMVRAAKEHEGAMSSPKACALCGLKRNERIAKIDVEVLDSFGEWWVEHWGHRTCKSFWDVQQHNLTAR